MKRKVSVTLTRPELDTIWNLVHEKIEDGSYYGNREQYYARLDRIKEALGGAE